MKDQSYPAMKYALKYAQAVSLFCPKSRGLIYEEYFLGIAYASQRQSHLIQYCYDSAEVSRAAILHQGHQTFS